MFVYTISKKKAVRTGLLILAVFAGIAIGIAAILTAVDIGAKEKKVPIYSVDRSDNKISLTFDCAWGNSNTDELLLMLEKGGVRATFFVTGEFCDKFPDDVRKMAAAGHEIANHSDAHPHIIGMNINDLIADTKEGGRKIEMITKIKPTLYRSPYGEFDDTSVSTIEGMGYKFIQWSVDSIDWQEPDSETIKKRVIDKTGSGSILLFHNDLKNTAEALPDIISSLKKSGFEFVPAGELIYYKDYYIDNTGKQIYSAAVRLGESGAAETLSIMSEISVEIPDEYDESFLDTSSGEMLDAYYNKDYENGYELIKGEGSPYPNEYVVAEELEK
ncbi:MAG: polysaccharide deacetylase family protein [Eubacterium sp.]|jgi:peptidoglycan/xylan/chitin deacetylase (PgdA/CDA1 family)|nr:polysaccharide deacetylase family protein [Eubacterium sp.]